jgi:ribosome-binding factor A
MKGYGGREPSQRQLRVGEQMRHLLAEDLMRGEIHDRRLEGVSITISEVRVSPDLRHAAVFASQLGGTLERAVLDALQHAAPYLAGRLARQMHLKYAPRLKFLRDETFQEAERIERLLADELEHRPRGSHPDEDGDGHGA